MIEHCCKYGRLAEKYDLEKYLGSLGDEWERDNGRGVRPLAAMFCRRVVRTKLIRRGIVPFEGEVQSFYAALNSDDDGMEKEHGRVERRLREYELDPEQLRAELPSARHYHRHLTECEQRDAPEPDITTEQGPEIARDRIRQLQHRMQKVADKSLTDLARADHLDTEDYTVTVSVDVECPTCTRHIPITTAIADGCPRCRPNNTVSDAHRDSNNVSAN